MKKFVAVVLVPFLLAGCATLEEWGIAKPKKERAVGQREAVLLTQENSDILKPETDIHVTVPLAQDLKEWPQAGQNAAHVTPHVKAAEKLHAVWKKSLKFKTSKRQRLLCEPVVAEGMLFVYTPDSYVSAYNAETGDFEWTIFLKPEKKQDAILGGGVAYNDGTLYVSTPFAELFALDVATGSPKWSVKTSGPLRSSPTFSSGQVYAVTINNELYAIDHKSGEVLWTHTGIMEFAGILGGCSPSCDKDVVIAPYTSGEVYALRAENGYTLWSESLASANRTDSTAGMPHIHAKPVIDGGRVYIVSNSGRTAAFDLRSGEVAWQKDFGGAQTPLVAGDFIYLVTSDNQLVCMTKEDGLVRWMEPLTLWKNQEKRKDRIVWSGPIMVGEKLFLTGSQGRLMAVNPADGSWAYEFKVPGDVVVPPIAANGTVYVVTDSGQLVAFR